MSGKIYCCDMHVCSCTCTYNYTCTCMYIYMQKSFFTVYFMHCSILIVHVHLYIRTCVHMYEMCPESCMMCLQIM